MPSSYRLTSWEPIRKRETSCNVSYRVLWRHETVAISMSLQRRIRKDMARLLLLLLLAGVIAADESG